MILQVKYLNRLIDIIIDEEDYPLIQGYTLNINKQKNFKFRVIIWVNSKPEYLHRFLMKPNKKQIIDHINGNPLDNRKSNLRFCNQTQNNQNMAKRQNTVSKYKGVWKRIDGRKKCWSAQIKVNGKKINLGSFYNEKDAAKAYEEAAKKYFKQFARLN